ncbi:unnamed protein product [Scytosiphon promiscuus]
MNEGGAQDVKERALKVTWKEVGDRPTDSELLSAFSPVGSVVRDKCAAVLFASAESVAAAVAAVQDGPGRTWRVQPMADTRQKSKENISKAKRTVSPLNQLQRESNVLFLGKSRSVPAASSSSSDSGNEELFSSTGGDCRHCRQNDQQRLKTKSSRWGLLTEDALRKQQQQYLPGVQKSTERVKTRKSSPKDVHGSDDSAMCRQEPSPFSLPEELRAWSPCTQTRDHDGLKLKTNDEKKTGEHKGGLTHGEACTKTDGGPASSVGGDAVPPRSASDEPHLATDRRVHGQQQNQERSAKRASLDGNKSGGTDRESAKKGDTTTHGGDELPGRSDKAEAPDKQQAKQTKQAKRLALEVARLRSSLRATTSELHAERSARSRLEDEWWKKTRAWEEERSSLVTSTQNAERASKLAQEEVGRALAKGKAREVEITSERVVREAAQGKTESALKGVVNVQDRLLGALQSELEMTNRAREAAQDDSREAKEQLHLYVQDFLLWRDRAKRLGAREVQAGCPAHSKRHAEAPPACDSPSEPLQQRAADDIQRTTGAKDEDKSIEHASSAQAREPEVSSDLSIPEKYARYFETTTGGCASAAPSTEPVRLRQGDTPEGEPEAAAAAAAWSTRSAMAGALSSPSSRAYFQRSMKAQQEISHRLERDLVRARADLQAIYAGSRTRSSGESRSTRTEKNRDDDSQAREESCQILEGVDPDAGDAPDQQVVPDAAACTSVARHSYTGRVLAALLGGDLAASPRTTASGLPGASIRTLRLSDYPPALQAVFSEWPAAVPLPPAPAASPNRRLRGAEAPHHDRSRVPSRSPSWRAAPHTDENEGREQESLIGVDKNGSPPAKNAAALVAGENSSSSADANAAGKTSGVLGARGSDHQSADMATAAEGMRGGCSVSGAFRGYEAKSPFLRRWLGERFSPSPQPRMTAIEQN